MNTSCRYFRSKRFNAFPSKQMFKIQVVQTRYSQCTNTSIQALHSQFSFLPAAIHPSPFAFPCNRCSQHTQRPPRRGAGCGQGRGQRGQPLKLALRQEAGHATGTARKAPASRETPKAAPSTRTITAHPDPCISTKYRDRLHTLFTQQAAAALQTGFFHKHKPFCWLNLSQVPKEITTVKSILKFPKKRTGASAHLVHP